MDFDAPEYAALSQGCTPGDDCELEDGVSADASGSNDQGQPETSEPEVDQPDGDVDDTKDGVTDFEDTCVPDCKGKVCGNNSCGGSCGSCSDETPTCVQGKCFATPCENSSDCNDGNKCTNDYCTDGVCDHIPVNTDAGVNPCEDDNECTYDYCSPNTGECEYENTFADCDDGYLCTGPDYCLAMQCIGDPKSCDDKDECTTDSCDSLTGKCQHVEIPGCKCIPNCEDKQCGGDGCGKSCGSCDVVETCECSSLFFICYQKTGECSDSGKCTSVTSVFKDCKDENPCTNSSCDEEGGCVNTPNSDLCDDGLECTTGDTCSDGICQGTWDNQLCPCVSDEDCVDDGNLCNGTPVCDGESNTCVIDEATVVSCDNASMPTCKESVCVPTTGECAPILKSGYCFIDNKCWTSGQTDKENGQQCLVCSPAFPNEWHKITGDICTDGNACTVADKCVEGVCTPGTPYVCNDANPCVKPFSCYENEQGLADCEYHVGACEDGNLCTENTTCDAEGECVGGTPKSCDDGDPCTFDWCLKDEGCTHDPIDCSDYSDACYDGVCNGNSGCVKVSKGDCPSKPCHLDYCNVETGCYLEKFSLSIQKSLCDDQDDCTNDYCDDEGACVNEAIPNCPCEPNCDGKQCGDDGCGVSCGECGMGGGCGCDGLTYFCSGYNGQCGADGMCEQNPTEYTNCDDGLECTEDSCGAAGCINTPKPDSDYDEETFYLDNKKLNPKTDVSELQSWLDPKEWQLCDDPSTGHVALCVQVTDNVGNQLEFEINNPTNDQLRVTFYVESYYNYYPDWAKGSVELVQGGEVKCSVQLPAGSQKLCTGVIGPGVARVMVTEGQSLSNGWDVTLSNQGIKLEYACSGE